MTSLLPLRERVETATGPDRELANEVAIAVTGIKGFDLYYAQSRQTCFESIDAAVALVERVLPGWWISSGLCALTGHASIGPDYNGPHRERLLREFPEDRFDDGFHADLSPGDGTHRQCLAIIAAMLDAKIAAAALDTGPHQ